MILLRHSMKTCVKNMFYVEQAFWGETQIDYKKT